MELKLIEHKPNYNFDEFVEAVLRQICIATSISREELVKSFRTQHNA